MKKLSSYLSAGIAATATFQSSDAATIVTLYGPGAQNPSSSPATPTGIYFGKGADGMYLDITSSAKSVFAVSSSGYFSGGTNLKISGSGTSGIYTYKSSFSGGAQPGNANYANISFNGNDTVYEAVGQFNFDGLGGGYLIAIALNDDGSALSISQGKAAIDAVPEPSAIALLSLGACGLMIRRRKVA